MYGSDQAASVEVSALPNFVEVIRATTEMLGTADKFVAKTERPIRDKLWLTEDLVAP